MYSTKNFSRFPQEFGSILEDFFHNGKSIINDELFNENKMHVPVNISEKDNAYHLQVIAPGLQKEDIKLKLEKNVLTISFDKKEATQNEGEKFLRSEYKFKSFKRSFTMSDEVATANIEAKYSDGILYVTLPKKENITAESQEIKIS